MASAATALFNGVPAEEEISNEGDYNPASATRKRKKSKQKKSPTAEEEGDPFIDLSDAGQHQEKVDVHAQAKKRKLAASSVMSGQSEMMNGVIFTSGKPAVTGRVLSEKNPSVDTSDKGRQEKAAVVRKSRSKSQDAESGECYVWAFSATFVSLLGICQRQVMCLIFRHG